MQEGEAVGVVEVAELAADRRAGVGSVGVRSEIPAAARRRVQSPGGGAEASRFEGERGVVDGIPEQVILHGGLIWCHF